MKPTTINHLAICAALIFTFPTNAEESGQTPAGHWIDAYSKDPDRYALFTLEGPIETFIESYNLSGANLRLRLSLKNDETDYTIISAGDVTRLTYSKDTNSLTVIYGTKGYEVIFQYDRGEMFLRPAKSPEQIAGILKLMEYFEEKMQGRP